MNECIQMNTTVLSLLSSCEDMDDLPCPVNFFIPPCFVMNLGTWYTIACMYGVTRSFSYPEDCPPRELKRVTQTSLSTFQVNERKLYEGSLFLRGVFFVPSLCKVHQNPKRKYFCEQNSRKNI